VIGGIERRIMKTANKLQDEIFLFLKQNAGQKYTTAEIAKNLGITGSTESPCRYEELQNMLDQMARYDFIGFKVENRDINYFIYKREVSN
jgi:hypothetical protein